MIRVRCWYRANKMQMSILKLGIIKCNNSYMHRQKIVHPFNKFKDQNSLANITSPQCNRERIQLGQTQSITNLALMQRVMILVEFQVCNLEIKITDHLEPLPEIRIEKWVSSCQVQFTLTNRELRIRFITVVLRTREQATD